MQPVLVCSSTKAVIPAQSNNGVPNAVQSFVPTNNIFDKIISDPTF